MPFHSPISILKLLYVDQWGDIELEELSSVVVGTGVATTFPRQASVDSGGTNGGTALVRTGASTGFSIGKNKGDIDWTKAISLHSIISVAVATTNGKVRISLGKTTGDGVGVLARKGIGFLINNLALKGIVHNGTSETEVDLSTNLTASTVMAVTIKSDGAGNVEWFVDGVSKGSTADGPAASGTTAESVWQAEADNGADSASQAMRIHQSKYYVEQ